MDFLHWIRNQSDRVSAMMLTLAGVLAIYLGWLGVSSHSLPSEQIAYLASGATSGDRSAALGASVASSGTW